MKELFYVEQFFHIFHFRNILKFNDDKWASNIDSILYIKCERCALVDDIW